MKDISYLLLLIPGLPLGYIYTYLKYSFFIFLSKDLDPEKFEIHFEESSKYFGFLFYCVLFYFLFKGVL